MKSQEKFIEFLEFTITEVASFMSMRWALPSFVLVTIFFFSENELTKANCSYYWLLIWVLPLLVTSKL